MSSIGYAMKQLTLLAVSLLVSLSVSAQFKTHTELPAKKDVIGQTPALGWNSWNTFGCNVSETLIKEMADAMIASGMKDAGYEYINIDDCWQGPRDERGYLTAHKERFPNGIKAVADYVHSKGLKIGIYSDAGNKTCAGYPGSRGFEYQDALTFAEWGIDYLKYDWCNTENVNPIGAYTTMSEALRVLDHPILFSMCEWGDNDPWLWGEELGHSWRVTGDIYNCWDCVHNHGSWASLGVLPILDKRTGIRKYAGPGHFNDYDMMEVGNGMTEAQDRSHFSLWAMLASPLIAGNDLRTMSETTRKILTNKDVIAVNQDKLGIEALRWIDTGKLNVFIKKLENNELAVVFLNRGDTTLEYTHDWDYYHLRDDDFNHSIDFTQEKFSFRDLWKGTSGNTIKPTKMKIPAHDIVFLRLKPL
jgi:alpha-galactosidase